MTKIVKKIQPKKIRKKVQNRPKNEKKKQTKTKTKQTKNKNKEILISYLVLVVKNVAMLPEST